MSDKQPKLFTTNIKIMIVAVVVLFAGFVLLMNWANDSLIEDLDSMNCDEIKEYAQYWFDETGGQNNGMDIILEKFESDCNYLGKFFMDEVENVGVGLVFIPAIEMIEGVEYEIKIRTNRTVTIDEDEKEFNIEIGK